MIMTGFSQYFWPFVGLLMEMAPYLLLGFLIAGILHAFVPSNIYNRYLSGNSTKSVLISLLFGIPLPLCSCGVIPTAVGMRKEGASKGATTAFLIGTPQTGVDSIMATYSVLGLPFAILRPIVALVTGLFGGIATNHLCKEESISTASSCSQPVHEKQTLSQKAREALRYGFSQMIQDIGLWLVIGLIIAGLINIFVPDGFFTTFQDNHLLSILMVLVIAIPMYVCATGSIPIAAALMLKGLSPGAALVFLMAGPATNVASMLVLGKTLGRRALVVYLASIFIGAITFGLLTDLCLPREWFTLPLGSLNSACCHDEMATMSASWLQIASAIVLTALLVRALALRFMTKEKQNTDMKSYKITGMMCNHCRAHVQNAIEKVEGVTSVNVDLAAGTAEVEGSASAEAVIAAVTGCGYGCEVNG